MKGSIFAASLLALGAAFTQAASAKELDLSACTKDGKAVTVKVDVEGSLRGGDLDAVVRNTFQSTAAGMDAATITSRKGVDMFIDNITLAVMTAVMNGQKMEGFQISGKMPVVTGTACRVPMR